MTRDLAIFKGQVPPPAVAPATTTFAMNIDLDTEKVFQFSDEDDEFIKFLGVFKYTVYLKYTSATMRMLYLKTYLFHLHQISSKDSEMMSTMLP